jgi:GDPmannose 4,6-dehydratase
VYNLGAISFVALSWKQANLTGQITGMGVLNMLEAIRIFRRGDWSDVRFYQASSSEMFGRVREIPQTEATPFHPRSPYGSAKAFGHHTTVNYRESYGAFACSGILFNHTSPRRGEEFVTRKISKAAARISLGLQSSISLGNLESKRDWGYAPDYVRAMHAMLQQPEPDDYVIASGSTYSIGDLLDVAFSAVGIADWSPYVKIDERFMRPAEVDLLIGDSSKAQDKLGWNHTLDFQEIIGTIVRSELELAQSKDGAFHAPSASFPRVTRSD